MQRKAELMLVSRVELKSSRETEEMRRAGGQVPAFLGKEGETGCRHEKEGKGGELTYVEEKVKSTCYSKSQSYANFPSGLRPQREKKRNRRYTHHVVQVLYQTTSPRLVPA